MEDTPNDIHVLTLSQLGKGQDWRLRLAHDRPAHVLLWITRGQGRALLSGERRGIGAHNALFVPAGRLFALDMGRQSTGHAVVIPAGSDLRLPDIPRHLRIRDVAVQSELTGLIDAILREDQTKRPLRSDAVEAQGALLSVWLRRQLLEEEHLPAKRAAAFRLSERFCALLPARYASGDTMAAYAGTLGVTPTHLTRAVKTATGRTAAEVLTERVVHAARSLLADTDASAQAISQHLGFGSAAYFTRFIQQHTGQTPSKLRGG